MKQENIQYLTNDLCHKGYLAYKQSNQKLPAVIVAHAWGGRDEFACKKAEFLANLGYVGFALDMYGNGKIGSNNSENSLLMKPLLENRTVLMERVLSAYETVKSLPMVDSKKIAIIGFCFGGLCALDLARSGADLSGVVSFHGILSKTKDLSCEKIKAKILVLHGYSDPMVKPEQVLEFAEEMTKMQADFQIHMFGHTMHAFTNPLANDRAFGTVYNKVADERSWRTMKDFLCEVFS